MLRTDLSFHLHQLEQLQHYQQSTDDTTLSFYSSQQHYSYSPTRPGPSFLAQHYDRAAVGEMSSAAEGHDRGDQRMHHYQQQRRMEAQAYVLDRGQHDSRSSGGDASSRRGSLQPSPGASPLLSHQGTSVSSATTNYSPLLGSGQLQHQVQRDSDVNKLHSSCSSNQQLGTRPRPRDDYYTSYDSNTFYAPPPPVQHHQQPSHFAPPIRQHQQKPPMNQNYGPPPQAYRSSGYAQSSVSLPPSRHSISSAPGNTLSSYALPSSSHTYLPQPSSAPPPRQQQPPNRTYASYPAPKLLDSGHDDPVQQAHSLHTGHLPPRSSQDSWQSVGSQYKYAAERDDLPPARLEDTRKRARGSGVAGMPVQEQEEDDGESVDELQSEEGDGPNDSHFHAVKRARAALDGAKQQQQSLDYDADSSQETSTAPTPASARPPPSSARPNRPPASTGPKPTPEKKFACPHTGCNRAFARNFNLQSHIKSHLGVRDFNCPECTKKFSRKHDCTRHCIAIHNYDKDTGLPPEESAESASSSMAPSHSMDQPYGQGSYM